MSYGSIESQNGSIDHDRQLPITTSTTTSHRTERRFILPGMQVFAYAVGHIHNDICSAMWFTYLLVFMESVLEFDATTSGLLLLIGQIADGIATPIVGLESDRNLNSCHAYGKRKTWHLIGNRIVEGCWSDFQVSVFHNFKSTFLSMLTFPFIFQPCYGGEYSSKSALVFYYSMLIIIFQFTWAAIQINHMSMATDLSPYSCERVKLTARRSSFTVVSNILVYLFTWLVLHVSDRNDSDSQFSPSDAGHFRLIVITLVAVGLIFSAIFHVFVREKPHNIQIRRSNDEVNSVDFSDRSKHLQWKHWFRFRIFYQVAALYMASRLIVNLTQVFVPLYLHYTLDLNKESIAYIPLVIYVCGFVGSFLVEFFNKRFSNVQIFLAGSLLSLSAFTWIRFGTSDNYINIYIYVVSALIGLSGQTININSQSILNDMIGQNTASSAFVFGAMSFLDKFSNGAAVMIIQVMRGVDAFKGYKPFFRYVLSYVCGGASIVVILILLTILSHNFEDDLKRSRLSTSNPNGSINSISDSNNINRTTNNLVDCENDDDEEERPLLQSSSK